MKQAIKNYDSSYLYGKSNQGQALYEYLVKAERIDKKAPGFDNIRYVVKRNQVTSCLSALIDKESIVFTTPAKPLPRSFKVFAAKDVKDQNKPTKVFIDTSDILKFVNGEWTVRTADINKLVSYLACALSTLIYHTDPTLIINNTTLLSTSTDAFAKLASNIIDYMRIGGVDNVRQKMMYISALYYQIGILLKDDTPTVYQKALKVSQLSEREANLLQSQVTLDCYKDIKTFIDAVAKVLKVEDHLRLENFVDKWLFLYGSGTQYATEVFTAFSNLMLNAYVGAYLNNQNTIEKLIGRYMVEYSNTLFRLGGSLL